MGEVDTALLSRPLVVQAWAWAAQSSKGNTDGTGDLDAPKK